jgi:ParB/RepB/Spo0J family partition protein
MSSAPSRLATDAPDRPRRKFTVDALFTDHRPQAVGVTDLATAKEIRLDRIEADPDQPRRTFDPVKLAELAESIRLEGVLQPIAVRYDADRDTYVMLHGERRWRASREVGLQTIPAIVREVPAERRLVQQLMENVVRDDLNAVDRAAALRALKSQLGDAPWDAVADVVGIRRSRLFQLLGTEKLPNQAQDDIRGGRLSEKQSRALQGLAPGPQEALRAAILEHDLPADEALRLARALRDEKIADDVIAATAAIARYRSAAPRDGHDDGDSLGTLAAAIADAAAGGRRERQALVALADDLALPGYDRERLREAALTIAGSIARAPAADLKPGSAAFGWLIALHGALETVLRDR